MRESTRAVTRVAREHVDLRSAVWACVVLVLALIAWSVASDRYAADRISVERGKASGEAQRYADGLRGAVSARGGLVDGLASFVETREAAGKLTRESFDAFAEGQYSSGSGIRTIQIAPGGVIRWTYPLAGSEQAVGLDLLHHKSAEIRADAARAYATRRLTVSGPYDLAQGGLGLVLRKAVVVRGEVWGLAACVLDVSPLLIAAGLDAAASTDRFALVDDHGRVFAGEAGVLESEPVTATVALPEGHWTVAVAPRAAWATTVAPETGAFRLASLLVVALVTFLSYLLISRQRRLARMVGIRTAEVVESERRARVLFERSPVSLWEEDFSGVKRRIEEMREGGVTDLRSHLMAYPERLAELIALIRVVDANAATLALYDAPDKDTLVQGLTRYATRESERVFFDQIMAIADGRTEFWGDSELLTPAGVIRHVAVRWIVMPGHEKDFASVVVSVIDLTERVKAQQELDAIRLNLEELVDSRTAELVRVNRELQDAQRAKDAFLASMSHELRTPLNSVIGFTGIMLQEEAGPLTDEQRRQLEFVRRSGRQLLSLVNDVLDLAKIEAGRVAIEPAETDAVALASTVMALVRPQAEEKGLELVLHVPATGARLLTDAARATQILTNLASNAVKFTARGSVGITVRDGQRFVTFEVTDTGEGIPKAERERIFQPFYQLPSSSQAKAPGSGLGLAIARDLTELLSGTLAVDSAPAGGSIFTLRLPKRGPRIRPL